MESLSEVARKNFILANLGADFTTPLFRQLSGQFPFEVNKYTIYGRTAKQRNKKFNKILEKDKESFVLIVRDDNANLEDVLFVPSVEIIDQMRKREHL
jgi:hypothetical protein